MKGEEIGLGYDAVTSFGEDGRKRGDDRGGVEFPGGIGEEVGAGTEEEVAEFEVGGVAELGDGGADTLLGLLGDSILVAGAVCPIRGQVSTFYK